jgi:hypothetical protein
VAIYSLQHDYVSVKRHGPGRAKAGVRYITRAEANYIYTIGFDIDGRPPNKLQLRAMMQAIEDAQKRKDARICHTVINALPVELTDAQNQALVRSYVHKLAKGDKAPVIAAIHGAGSHNPHLHLFLVDREVRLERHRAINAETGKWETRYTAELGPSVNKLTHKPRERIAMGLEPNATEWLRKVWEDTGNDHLERAGFERMLDRRSLLEQGVDRTPEKHRGWEEEIAPTRPDTPLEHEAAVAAPMEPYQEAPMDPEQEAIDDAVRKMSAEEKAEFIGEIEYDEPAPDLPTRIKRGLDADLSLSHLRQGKERIATLSQAVEQAKTAAYEAARFASEKDLETEAWKKAVYRTSERLSEHTKPGGKLKGLSVRLFGLELHTPARRKALEAKAEASYVEREAHAAELDRNAATYQALVKAKEENDRKSELEAAEHALDRTIKTFGDEMDFESAEVMLASERLTQFRGLSGRDIYAEYETGTIDAGDAIRACEIVGDTEHQVMIEQRQRQELEQEAERADDDLDEDAGL